MHKRLIREDMERRLREARGRQAKAVALRPRDRSNRRIDCDRHLTDAHIVGMFGPVAQAAGPSRCLGWASHHFALFRTYALTCGNIRSIALQCVSIMPYKYGGARLGSTRHALISKGRAAHMHSSQYSELSLHKRAPLAHIARALSRWCTCRATIATGIAGAYSGLG